MGADIDDDRAGEADAEGLDDLLAAPSGALEGGVLYLVPTPIGNLGDMSPRALAALTGADLIACEDTRVTRRLLSALGASARGELVSNHDHNEEARAAWLVERLRAGASVALVSDAGTPGCSDPGYRAVAAATAAGLRVVPIPGPAAFLAAWVASGLPTDRLHFAGFPPSKAAARRRFLEALAALDATIALYESPHRLPDLLDDIAATLGPTRRLCIARELTKRFEELLHGTAPDLATALRARPALRGEIVVLIEGNARAETPTEGEEGAVLERAQALVRTLQRQGLPPRTIKAIVAEHYALNKKAVFALLGGDPG